MVPEADVPWPMKMFCYILPLKYFLKSAMHTDLHKTTFSGAIVDAEDPRGFSCPRNGITREMVEDKVTESHNSLACYGYYAARSWTAWGLPTGPFHQRTTLLRISSSFSPLDYSSS